MTHMDTIMEYINLGLQYWLAQSLDEQKALLAGALVFVGYIIYWFATAYGFTRPNRTTWLVLSIVGVAVAVSYWDASDVSPNAKGLAIAHALGAFGTFISSIWKGQKYGKSDEWQRVLDKVCLGLALVSIAIWQAGVYEIFTPAMLWGFAPAFIALMAGILADFFGLIPTLVKAWKDPVSESRPAWGITVLGEIIGLFAITNWASAAEVSYPLYLALANGLVLVFLLTRRRKKYQPQPRLATA